MFKGGGGGTSKRISFTGWLILIEELIVLAVLILMEC